MMQSSSYAERLELPSAVCELSYNALNVSDIIASVGDDGAGGTAVFIGTTRNSFNGSIAGLELSLRSDLALGKVVTRLEYQAYTKLAMKTMCEIVRKAQSASELIRCAVHHRLGPVAIGEPSIVIAVSSAHRKEAFDACSNILEEIKQRAQIWKREYYEGENEEPEWKANSSK